MKNTKSAYSCNKYSYEHALQKNTYVNYLHEFTKICIYLKALIFQGCVDVWQKRIHKHQQY